MRTWKNGERRLACYWHAERQPNTGKAGADLVGLRLVVEAKCWRRRPLFVDSALAQAERGRDRERARDGISRLAIAVLHADRTDYGEDIACLRSRELRDLLDRLERLEGDVLPLPLPPAAA